MSNLAKFTYTFVLLCCTFYEKSKENKVPKQDFCLFTATETRVTQYNATKSSKPNNFGKIYTQYCFYGDSLRLRKTKELSLWNIDTDECA